MISIPISTSAAGRFGLCSLTLAAAVLGVVSLDAIPRENLQRTLEAQYAIVREAPFDPEAHNDLANLLVLAGLDAEAEASYQRAIELGPQAHEPRFNIALLFQQAGRVEEARAAFEELLAIYPTDARSHYQLGVLFEDEDQRPKAIDSYARAFALNASLTFARNNPHIIDSKLTTEALLLSAEYSNLPGAMVPRLYNDRKRIQSTLLDWDGEARETYDVEPAAEDLALPTEIRPAGKAEDPTGEMGQSEEDETRSTGGRVIGNEDLESGVASGQVQRSGGSIGRRSSASRRNTASSRSSGGAVTRSSVPGRFLGRER